MCALLWYAIKFRTFSQKYEIYEIKSRTKISAITVVPGPKLQRELNDVLLRFRRQPVAVVCDIAEMYLRIGLAPEEHSSHRFLWRDCNLDQPVSEFEFNRVVFGVIASPFLAQFVSQQHAKALATELPLAADTMLRSTYSDDSMDSATNDEEAILLYKQLCELWERSGMKAKKWLSNSVAVLNQVPPEDRALEINLDNIELLSAGLEKSGRIVAFCDWNARFCDQKTLCSRNFAPKTRRPGASLRPDEHFSRPDSENKN